MTPIELLEDVKGQFVVLYYNDEAALKRFLKQSMCKYQEKAGVLMRVKINAEDGLKISYPPHYLSIALASDNNANFVSLYDDNNGSIVVEDSTLVEYPITLNYYASLMDWPESEALPLSCISLVMSHLKALIEIQNTEVARGAFLQNGYQVELPSLQELRDVVATIELAMEDSRALPIPAAVF